MILSEKLCKQSDLVSFLIRAKQKTYAGHCAEVAPSRPASHDLRYEEIFYLDKKIYELYFHGGIVK